MGKGLQAGIWVDSGRQGPRGEADRRSLGSGVALWLYLEKCMGEGSFVTPAVDLQVHSGEAAET